MGNFIASSLCIFRHSAIQMAHGRMKKKERSGQSKLVKNVKSSFLSLPMKLFLISE